MGVTGLARWVNAPTTGLDLVAQNIIRNHQGVRKGKWHLAIKSWRSTLGSTPGFQVPVERSMCALTMNENVFVLLEDPAAFGRADLLQQEPPEGQAPIPLVGPGAPTHYRTTFLTLSPPGALEELIQQLRAKWVSVRQSGAGAIQRSHASGQQLYIEGAVFSIGNDFLVRVGNVVLAGGAVKGMLLEAEYLPLPTMQQNTDGTLELLSNLLISILPNVRDAKTVAVTMSDAIWEEVLWDREQEEEQMQADSQPVPEKDEDIYVCGDADIPSFRKGDWIGVDRDRRSAFLIIGALKSEGLL